MRVLIVAQAVPNDVAAALGRALRTRRKALHISMTAAAEAAGLSRVTWHRLEKGETGVAWGFVLAATAVVGLQLGWTQGGDLPEDQAMESHSPEDWLPLNIRLDDYPGLRRLAWQMREGLEALTPREAWELYDRNGRHLDTDRLTPKEKALIGALHKVFDRTHAGV